MKMLNASIFCFIILNLIKKGILDFHVTTAADIYMKEVTESTLEVTEALKALISTIIVLNLVRKCLFFTVLPFLRDSVKYKQFIVPFIDGSRRPGVFLKISQQEISTRKHLSRSFFFIKSTGPELY